MKEEDNQKLTRLCFGSVVFGIILTICTIIIIRSGSQIEFAREHMSFLKDLLYWLFELVIILVNIAIPWFVWKKLVKPYL